MFWFRKMARRLVCSYGTKFNCSGRISSVKLVQDGVINPEGFYNYLTAWFNADNMMYYVSQAAFFPTPPGWAFKDVSFFGLSLKGKRKKRPELTVTSIIFQIIVHVCQSNYGKKALYGKVPLP